MNDSIEEQILAEIERHWESDVQIQLQFFNQICTRLGLEEEKIKEMTPRIKRILSEKERREHH